MRHRPGSRPTLRLWLRALLVVLAGVAWLAAVPQLLLRIGWPPLAAFVVSGLVVVVGGIALLYALVRCPKCGKWACRHPRGYITLLPGLRCRYCGRSY